MRTESRLFVATAAALLLIFAVVIAPAAPRPAAGGAQAQKAELPVLVTSCGQSPGPTQFEIFLKQLNMNFALQLDAGPADLAKGRGGVPYRTLIIVTGASLKGMGAAGVSIEEEIARIQALIAAARKQNIKVIGAHVEGMKRRAQGAAPGDNSDEMSIDAVCPLSSLLIVKKEGDEDGRFTAISKDKGIPMLAYDKNLELKTVLQNLFGK